jgi:hypothetical protein
MCREDPTFGSHASCPDFNDALASNLKIPRDSLTHFLCTPVLPLV